MLDFHQMQRIFATSIAVVGILALLVIGWLAVLLVNPAKAGDYHHESRATNRAHCMNYGVDAACAYRKPWRVRQAQRREWERRQADFRGYRRERYLPGVVVHRRTYKIDRRARWDDDDEDDRHDRRRQCRPELAAVGDQYASEQGAQQEADKAWMQTARWQHGERFMSRENASHAAYECGRSSVGSVVGQVFYRCRLTASPCAPTSTRAN